MCFSEGTDEGGYISLQCCCLMARPPTNRASELFSSVLAVNHFADEVCSYQVVKLQIIHVYSYNDINHYVIFL